MLWRVAVSFFIVEIAEKLGLIDKTESTTWLVTLVLFALFEFYLEMKN